MSMARAICGMGVALAASQAALGQNADVQDDSAASTSVLEEIIVTAQKRSVEIDKIPSSVSVLSAGDLESLHVTSFDQLTAAMPGYNFERTSGGNTIVSIRGVGTTSSSQSLEQSVAPYMNGVYMGGNLREFATPLYDLERVEVLRGTQSGISGQNTSVGSVNFVTQQPGSDFGGYVRLGREFEYDGWNAEGGLDLPLSEDFALRLSGFYEDTDGWTDNVATNTKGPRGRTYSGRVNAVWQTADNLKVSFFGQYDDGQRYGIAQIPFGPPTPFALQFMPDLKSEGTRSSLFSSRSKHDGDEGFEFDGLRGALTFDLDLNWATFTSVTAASRINDVLTVDTDTLPLDLQWLYQDGKYEQVHQEFRLVSEPGDHLSYIVGAWYRHAKWDKQISFHFDSPPIPGPNWQADLPYHQKTDTASVFADLDYKLNEKWTIGGTARYTSETKEAEVQSISNWPFVFTSFPLTKGELTPEFLDGSVRLQYSPTNSTLFYALYAHGTKTGSFLDLTNAFTSLNPERANTYEIGSKVTFQNGLFLTAALFRLNVNGYQDVYVSSEGGLVQFIADNRDIHTEGLELSLNWSPIDNLLLGLSGTGMKSHDEAGGDAQRAPDLQVAGNFRYELPLDGMNATLALFGNASYRDDYFNKPLTLGPVLREKTVTPAYTLVDLGVELNLASGFSATALVKNVTDEYTHLAAETITGDPDFQSLGNQLPLRQYYLTLGYKF